MTCLQPETFSLPCRFRVETQLLRCWSEPVSLSSWRWSMSLVFGPLWHAAGTECAAPDCQALAAGPVRRSAWELGSHASLTIAFQVKSLSQVFRKYPSGTAPDLPVEHASRPKTVTSSPQSSMTRLVQCAGTGQDAPSPGPSSSSSGTSSRTPPPATTISDLAGIPARPTPTAAPAAS